MREITAFAPATIANFNVGFDIMGAALQNIGDTVTVKENGTAVNRIVDIVNGANLPIHIDKNCCSVVIKAMQQDLNDSTGVDITINKGFASGSGLGSSSASSAAAAVAFNHFMGDPFTLQQLVFYAAQGEKIACGSPHTDNVAPSILGGLVLATTASETTFIQLPVFDYLHATLLYPAIELKTSDSRSILRAEVPVATVTKQIGYATATVASLFMDDTDLFKASMNDVLIEPMRSMLIPKFQELRQAALDAGALAFGISGSGPSVFALSIGEQTALQIEQALISIYEPVDIDCTTYISPIDAHSGATILNNT